MESEKRGPGKPRKDIPLSKLKRLCQVGLTDEQLAAAFDCSRQTIARRKLEPDFKEAIENSKELADSLVEHSLWSRAIGYQHPETKFFQHNGKILKEDCTKYYPPDTAAAFIWLKNRQPGKWKDKKELVGKDDSPLFGKIEIELVKASGKDQGC